MDSVRDIKEIRKAEKDDNLTKQEIKEYRKVTGKLSWLANSTRPDLSYTALAMSKRITQQRSPTSGTYQEF